MAWFKKEKAPKQKPPVERRVAIPEGLWIKCKNCREIVYKKEVARNANVCPKCNYHFRISARERIEALLDEGLFQEFDQDIAPVDSLGFVDTVPYAKKLEKTQAETGLKDALISCTGTLGGHPVVIGAMEFAFMGGSMGSVVGEKVCRCAEKALDQRRALLVISCSGGARMHEGALSLMQMAKVSAALARLDEARLPFLSILTDPTTGGVTASYAMLGDLNIAEPKALIGFAGPRVIEQTIRQKLPLGFQRSEFLLEHGMVDIIVERSQMRELLISCLAFMMTTPERDQARLSQAGTSIPG